MNTLLRKVYFNLNIQILLYVVWWLRRINPFEKKDNRQLDQICCCCLVAKLFATPWTIADQAPLFMGFPRQEYWNELPFPSPGGFHDTGIEPKSFALAGGFSTAKTPGKPKQICIFILLTEWYFILYSDLKKHIIVLIF